MDTFIRAFLDKTSLFSSNKLSIDCNLEANVIQFIQKTILKHDVLLELKSAVNSACSSQRFTVTNETVKKIVFVLHETLSSDVANQIKKDAFCYFFKSFAASCKDETLPKIQFFIVLCHILGFEVASQVEGSEPGFVVNAKNFETAFQVTISSPTPVSFTILKELLGILSKLSININSLEAQYCKWFQQLVKSLTNSQEFDVITLEILSKCAEIDYKLLEGNFDQFFGNLFSQNPFSTNDFCTSYGEFLKTSFLISAKYQRVVKFISKFLSNVKNISTKMKQDVILPSDLLTDFSKVMTTLSNQQSLSLMEILVQFLVESCSSVLESPKSGVSCLLFGVTSQLLTSFLKEVKVCSPTMATGTSELFIKNLNCMKDALQRLGSFLMDNSSVLAKKKALVTSFLELSFYLVEIQSLVYCYKNSSQSFPEDWHCCLGSKDWQHLTSDLLQSKFDSVRLLCFQLALQRLRILKLEKKLPTTEDSAAEVIISQFTSDACNTLRWMTPEDMTILMEVLTMKQSRLVVKKLLREILESEEDETEWLSWLTHSRLQENSTFNLNLFSELLKQVGCVLKKSLPELGTWLTVEHFDKNNNVNASVLEDLPGNVNGFLENRKKIRKTMAKNSGNDDVLRKIVRILKLLPLAHMSEDIRRLGLSFAFSIAVSFSGDEFISRLILETIHDYLTSDVDSSTCFDIGLAIRWLSELSFENDDVRVRVIELLVRSCPNTKFGLSQLGQIIDEPLKGKTSRFFETRVILYQELGKCWLRAKKRKSDNDIIGSYRNKLVKVISEESKDPINDDNHQFLIKAFAIELNKAVKTKNEEEIATLIKLKFPPYFEFAVNRLKDEFDEACASFLSIIVQFMPQIREHVPDDTFMKIWHLVKGFEKGNWHLFSNNSKDEEFDVILLDLLQLTKEVLSSKFNSLPNYFSIWVTFFDVDSDFKREQCQLALQELFRHIRYCDLLLKEIPTEGRISLTKFMCSCLSTRKMKMTSLILDTMFDVMLQWESNPRESTQNFHSLFSTQIEAASSILKKEFVWNSHRVHLTFVIFKQMLNMLTNRSDVGSELNNYDVILLSLCALSLEKFASLIVKRQEDFARIAAYFITAIISSISTVTVVPAIKIHLINCIDHFLSISDSHTVSYLLRVLKPGYQQVFNGIYDQFKKYHKYTGKV